MDKVWCTFALYFSFPFSVFPFSGVGEGFLMGRKKKVWKACDICLDFTVT